MSAVAWFVASWCVGFALRRWTALRPGVVRHPPHGIGDASKALQDAIDHGDGLVQFAPGTYNLHGRFTVASIDDDNNNHGV